MGVDECFVKVEDESIFHAWRFGKIWGGAGGEGLE
jgi:hypothetical protein